MNFPAELKYSKSHEWVRMDGEIAVVGISDFAQDALGDVVFINLPTEGDAVTAGESFGDDESVKAVSDMDHQGLPRDRYGEAARRGVLCGALRRGGLMSSYVPTTAAEREEMLAAIGVKSLEDLYQAVPQGMLLNGKLNIPGGMSELEVREAVTAMAEKNKVYKTVLRGAGAYRHFIPAVVKSRATRGELDA